MLNDKEFLAFQEGIFKGYFEKYIIFKRGKGEKVHRSTLIRLKSLNQALNQSCHSLEINRNVAEFILREKESENSSTRNLRIQKQRLNNSLVCLMEIHDQESDTWLCLHCFMILDAESKSSLL